MIGLDIILELHRDLATPAVRGLKRAATHVVTFLDIPHARARKRVGIGNVEVGRVHVHLNDPLRILLRVEVPREVEVKLERVLIPVVTAMLTADDPFIGRRHEKVDVALVRAHGEFVRAVILGIARGIRPRVDPNALDILPVGHVPVDRNRDGIGDINQLAGFPLGDEPLIRGGEVKNRH